MKIAFWRVNPSSEDFLTRIESILINLFSGRRGFWHAELMFDDGTSFSSTLVDGSIFYFRRYRRHKEWLILDIGLKEYEEKIKKWCETKINIPYDLRGVLGFVLPWEKHQRKKAFCSEIVVEAVQQANLFLHRKPWKVSPNNLYRMCKSYGFSEE